MYIGRDCLSYSLSDSATPSSVPHRPAELLIGSVVTFRSLSHQNCSSLNISSSQELVEQAGWGNEENMWAGGRVCFVVRVVRPSYSRIGSGRRPSRLGRLGHADRWDADCVLLCLKVTARRRRQGVP